MRKATRRFQDGTDINSTSKRWLMPAIGILITTALGVAINFATDLRSSWLAWLAVAVLTVVGYACGRIVDRVGRSDGTQLAGRPEESDRPGHSVADSRGTFLQAGGNITIGGPGHGRAILAGLLALVALVVSVMAIAPSFRPTFLVGEPARGAQNHALSIVGLDLASTVELTRRTDYSGGDDKVGVVPVNAAATKIVLHNNGEQAALISELRVHISQVWTPETCDGAGPASTSISYDFVLPSDIHRQTFPLRLSKRIDFHVAGKSNDRLAVTIGEERLGETGWAWITSASAELVLADGQTVRTGEFVLMNSTEIDRTVELARDDVKEADTDRGRARIQCIQRNIGKLEEALRAPGVHSPSIQLLLNRLDEIGFTTGEVRTTTTTPPTAAVSTTATRSAPPAAPAPYLNTWVAQLASLPQATTKPAQLQAKVADLQRQTGVTIQSIRSESYGSLMPGYWILFYPGHFSDGHDALNFCTDHGISDEKLCAGRYLSSSASDRELNCHFSDPRDSVKCVRP